MKRYLDDRVQADLAQKMVFLTGPRQVGKTTLSRQLIAQRLEPTLSLMVVTLILAIVIAVPMGVIAAWKAGTSGAP